MVSLPDSVTTILASLPRISARRTPYIAPEAPEITNTISPISHYSYGIMYQVMSVAVRRTVSNTSTELVEDLCSIEHIT